MKPNRAVVALVTIVLALATALTLVGTAVTLADTPAAADRSTADIAVVHRFYDAVNTAIASGDLTDLDAIVGPDFTLGTTGGIANGGLDELHLHLLALHSARPGLWIRVEETIAGGEQVVARVAFDGLADSGAAETAPLAVPAPGSPLWEAGDRFRVVAGRIVAFEGVTLALGAPRSLLDQVVAVPEGGQTRLGLARLTITPGATITAATATGPAVYVVERGAVSLHLTDATGANRIEQQLGEGERFAVPTGFGVTFNNPSPDPAVLVTVALTVAVAPWPPSFGEPVSVAEANVPTWLATQLAVTPEPVRPGAPVRETAVDVITLGTATIVPGRLGLTGEIRLSLSWLTPGAGRNVLTLPADGPALLAVEIGQALVTSAGGPSDLIAPEASAVAVPVGAGTAPTVVLDAGQAALAEPGSTLTVQSAGDGAPTFLLLTLAPA